MGEVQLAALARFRAHRSAQQAWHVLRAHARAVAAPARRAREQSEVACGFAEVLAVQEGRDALGRRDPVCGGREMGLLSYIRGPG